jgi:2-dehydro-3-deoxyphosphogluconate aldolase/(4S)-4-hydroxy-2-oxoglutarate aldolase
MIPVLDKFEKMGVIPVVAIENSQDAAHLADYLIEGGLPCAEITFRTPAAIDAMRIMAQREEILVGAGTVLKVDQVKAALDAGARFMVSPGFNPKVVAYCIENNVTITPGICTPSDIEAALEFGLDVLKFFPAEAFGGLKTLKALSGPYGAVRFIPTGGVSPESLVDYLRFPGTLACGGTWIAKANLISEGKFDLILSNTREAVQLVKKAQASS